MVERRHRIAYHEAGHAVIAVLMGREIRSVSLNDQQIVLDSERLKAVLAGKGPLSSDDQEHCEQEVKIALGGYGGEVVGLGGPSFVTAYDDDIPKANAV